MTHETDLRDGPFAFSDLLEATSGHGTIGFQCSSEDVRYRCLVCNATFEQTVEGWQALRAHEGEHGRAQCVSLSEIDGRTLRMVVWASNSTRHSWASKSVEIWGVDDERGVVYCLSNAYQDDKVWKWRISGSHSGVLGLLNAPMPSGPVCP